MEHAVKKGGVVSRIQSLFILPQIVACFLSRGLEELGLSGQISDVLGPGIGNDNWWNFPGACKRAAVLIVKAVEGGSSFKRNPRVY